MAKTIEPKQQAVLDAMPKLMAAFEKDWKEYNDRAKVKYPNSTSERNYSWEKGSTYIRMVVANENGSHRSVVGFVQYKDGKFPAGTILKAAGWKAPATNFGRGVVADPATYQVRWTGVY